MIYIRTTAYNASQTLERTIRCVLNQTYGGFQYFLVENGSTDNGKTKKIVEKYAKRDGRIRAYFNEKNHVWDKNQEVLLLPHQIGEEDYFCLLDADDEYYPTFFEDMLRFMEQNKLDIAACGNDFIRAADNKLMGQRMLSQDLILEGNSFANYFPYYHQFMRTIWGKLFKGKTLKHTILDTTSPKMPKVYGNDTFFTMCAFRDAKRAGILAKSLHRYYMSPKSVSYIFDPDRSRCDRILRNAAIDFLKPYGPISRQNQDFLNVVHANASNDTLLVILNSKISEAEKIKWIKELFSDEGITELLQSSAEDVVRVRNQISQTILNWLSMGRECVTAKEAEAAADIVSLLLSNGDAFYYLFGIRMKRPDFIAELKKIKWIENHLLDTPMTKYVSMDLAFSLPDTMQYLLDENYQKAWETFISHDDIEISDEDEESYYLLGQNLAAMIEDADAYIFFKGKWISCLIDQMRIEEAEKELYEFNRILPNDKVFKELRDRLNRFPPSK